MLKAFKTEIDPTPEQRRKINQTIGVCRFVYNLFVAQNSEWHDEGKRYMSAKSFSIWLNNEYIPANPDKAWIKSASSKAVKQSLENAHAAYMRFFDGKAEFPKFKKKNSREAKMHFFRNDAKHLIGCERHRIKIPTLGWVRLKEKGYLPASKDGRAIRRGSVSREAGRYYVSVLIDMPGPEAAKPAGEPIGIDLGVKELAVCSDGRVFRNVNKTPRIAKLERSLRRQQRSLSRKYEMNREGKRLVRTRNSEKQRAKVQRLHKRLSDARDDYVNKAIGEMVKTKPSYVAIEDLNVSGMMKNKHLSKAIRDQRLSEFRRKLTDKCKERGIEVRVVDRFYPSSKMCHACGKIKADLKLSDRIYRCDCGYVADRDLNAALNLRDSEEYATA